jgi:hypothetical protein
VCHTSPALHEPAAAPCSSMRTRSVRERDRFTTSAIAAPAPSRITSCASGSSCEEHKQG